MDTLLSILFSTWDLYLDAAVWLVVGIVAAGALHVWMPDGLLRKWLGGKGAGPVVKAALVGAPLPLCSCGVLPAAVGLRKDGASRGATVSFLIATPETGPDSVALSYALLGPVMAVVRPIAAVFSAIVSGLLANALGQDQSDQVPVETPSACCSATCCGSEPPKAQNKIWSTLRYGFVDILDDIAVWLMVGLVLAGALTALVEPQAIADYGSGLGAMLVMVVVGIPIYVCATASTPIAAGFMAVGVSPGAALVFLLVGPATNIATLGVIAKDLGLRTLMAYLSGIIFSAIAAGYATDALLNHWDIEVLAQMAQAGDAVPGSLNLLFGIVLVPFLGGSVWRSVRRTISKT